MPIENVRLKDENGALVFKVKAAEGRDLTVDARTGAAVMKDGYRRREHAPGGAVVASGTNWGKVVNDLHTGRILGGPGRLLVDVTSFVLLVLTFSGIYLWAVPKLRKRAAPARPAAAVGVTTASNAAVSS